MKYFNIIIVLFIACSVFANNGIFDISKSNLPAILYDNSSFYIRTGVFSTNKLNSSYSIMGANFIKQLSSNFSLNYNINYLNYNMENNYIIGGIGLTYQKNNFMLQIYFEKTLKNNFMF